MTEKWTQQWWIKINTRPNYIYNNQTQHNLLILIVPFHRKIKFDTWAYGLITVLSSMEETY